MGWFSGSKSKVKQHSLLSDTQKPLQQQYEEAMKGAGAGGSAGDVADYYRNLLSNDSGDFNAMAAPEMRRFNEEIIPGISEQFAGMGAGGLSSSGFQNSATQAGADLSERLGAIRAQLRMQGAQGLQKFNEFGMRPTVENVMHQGQPGFGQPVLGGISQGVGSALPGLVSGGMSGWGTPGVKKNAQSGWGI